MGTICSLPGVDVTVFFYKYAKAGGDQFASPVVVRHKPIG